MLSVIARDAALSAIGTLLNGGELRIFTATGTLLASGRLSARAFARPTAGQMISEPIASAPVLASGDAARFAFTTTEEKEIFSGRVGIPGSGAGLVFPSTMWAAGEVVDLDPYTLALPA
jgi:hypothetical protein